MGENDFNDNPEETEEEFYGADPLLHDVNKWLTMPTWTIEEAVALSLGRNPDVVKTQTIPRHHPFTEKFLTRSEQLTRAIDLKRQLPSEPSWFVYWFDANDVDTDVLKVDQEGKDNESVIATSNALFDAVRKRGIRNRYQQGRKSPSGTARAQNTADKLFLAMAANHYGFNGSKDSVTAVAKEIAKITSVSVETIQTRLQDAWSYSKETSVLSKAADKFAKMKIPN